MSHAPSLPTSAISAAITFNHISFPSTDVDATARFFERYLGCSVSSFDNSRIVKRFDFDIVIEGAGERAVAWPSNFHIGFEVPTAAEVALLFRQFQEDGAQLSTALLQHVRGSRFFAVIPGGVQVEINTREDAAEAFRASFGR